MSVYVSPYVVLDVDTSIYTSGDALGAVFQIPNVPEHGTIMSINVLDHDSENDNLDVYFFKASIAETSENGAFSPTDAEMENCLGAVLVDTWKVQEDNGLGVVDNVGLPYWAPEGILYCQAVTRGTPTYTAVTDIEVSVGIVY